MLGPLKNNSTGLPKALKELGKKYLSENVRRHAVVSAMVLFSSYVLASAASSFTIPLMMKSLVGGGGRNSGSQLNQKVSLKSVTRPNFHKMKRSVMDRNLFNQSGEFPEEEEEVVEQANKTSGDFDMAGPCTPTSLKISLIGTIFLGKEGPSMATIKESGFEVDIYKEGDAIIGHEDAQIVSIERNRVIINNSGAKECLIIKLGGEDRLFVDKSGKKKKAGDVDASGETVILSGSYVEKELGDGFGKIIQSARLVPNMVDQRVNGFKIFAIQKGSLLEKVGFKNGDVITQVNDTVMEAEHGFALYQALLDERDLTIRVLRGGKTPVSLSVRIK